MRILITNDDGVNAQGLMHLCAAFQDLAEVLVVAPDRQRSGVSHSVTISEPLRLERTTVLNGLPAYTTNGAPADCVALAVAELGEGGINLVLSGINHGWNLGVDCFYSGTVMAAAEASLLALPAIAISVGGAQPDRFLTAARFARLMAERVLQFGLPQGTFLNVNVPSIPRNEIKGVAVTSLSRWSHYDRFERRSDPHGGTYYWRSGINPFQVTTEGAIFHDAPPGTDTHAVFEGLVSVTPLRLDFTDAACLETIASWKFDTTGDADEKPSQ